MQLQDIYSGPYTLADEGVHPIANEHPSWNESWVVDWYDLHNGVGAMHRAGQELNRGMTNYWLGVMSKEGWRYRAVGEGYKLLEEDRGPDGFGITSDNGRHHLTFDADGIGHLYARDGDVEVDLRIESFHPMSTVWEPDEATRRFDQTMVPNHYEGSGRCWGTLRARGREWEIDGLCHRDHSWGNRQWDVFTGHRWIVGSLGRDLSFSGFIGTSIHDNGAAGSVVQAGFVARGNEIIRTEHLDCIVYLEPDGITHRGGEATFYLPGGNHVHLRMNNVNGIMFQTREFIEAGHLTEARDDDGREGYAYLEISNNIRMGTLPIHHTIGAAWTPGYSEIDFNVPPGKLRGLV
jgi:hypothetical protein